MCNLSPLVGLKRMNDNYSAIPLMLLKVEIFKGLDIGNFNVNLKNA